MPLYSLPPTSGMDYKYRVRWCGTSPHSHKLRRGGAQPVIQTALISSGIRQPRSTCPGQYITHHSNSLSLERGGGVKSIPGGLDGMPAHHRANQHLTGNFEAPVSRTARPYITEENPGNMQTHTHSHACTYLHTHIHVCIHIFEGTIHSFLGKKRETHRSNSADWSRAPYISFLLRSVYHTLPSPARLAR